MKPRTGVIYFNDLNLDIIAEESYIDITYEEALLEKKKELIQKIKECETVNDLRDCVTHMDEDVDNFIDTYECLDHEDYKLYGSWKKNKRGKYYPDKTGLYSAICRDGVLQVVWSKYKTHCKLCSPCYLGQGNLEEKDEDGYLTYDLPKEYYIKEDENNEMMMHIDFNEKAKFAKKNYYISNEK